MAKELRTADELQALIMSEVAKEPDCQGCTGVTIIPLNDPRIGATWSVDHAHNASRLCADQIEQVAAMLMGLYDLKRE
jgi:hypothetical protein